jgi:hypothetical protein
MRVGVWFDFFARQKGGSDDRGVAFVLPYTFTPRLIRYHLSLDHLEDLGRFSDCHRRRPAQRRLHIGALSNR